ncbi:hypothetical protein DY000_02008285 [Brassica cretica]|uniref:Uncharacterized protein n=1 Tax=Brassica cretica TaxID=69181 RepID=A0ABQ7CAA7_BRACR|nr:hypothetical protein DY000_02008285 [Brassica cretica]
MDPNQTFRTVPSGIDNADPTGSNLITETLPVGPTGTDGTTRTPILESEPRARCDHRSMIGPHHQITLRFRKGPRSPIEPELESGIALEKDRPLTT